MKLERRVGGVNGREIAGQEVTSAAIAAVQGRFASMHALATSTLSISSKAVAVQWDIELRRLIWPYFGIPYALRIVFISQNRDIPT